MHRLNLHLVMAVFLSGCASESALLQTEQAKDSLEDFMPWKEFRNLLIGFLLCVLFLAWSRHQSGR